ncbi:hypothetical protein BDP27DRAFT_1431151 [Rhodocollybia butyracea]|uniref:HTH CENPB-type domain-containing protein n=1 Tax=Rhodocollybia butyracea TaxID=206335 RepID=A0A9P5P971_9AGAR|nr:hypothetical protein BDP27DRAFT_1431151 [Rhodocollybia butyracea]
MKGVKNWTEAHTHEQLLSPGEEAMLVEWTKVMGHRGVPISLSTLSKYATHIYGQPVGISWPCCFREQHPKLALKWTSGLEQCCARNLNQPIVSKSIDMYGELIQKYDISPSKLYNMDEKGIQLGIGKHSRPILVNRDQKIVQSIQPGNRELITKLVTIVEGLCADGSALHSSVIFEGVRWDLRYFLLKISRAFASQKYGEIDKYNLLSFYSAARTQAFKSQTIVSAFHKTGSWPVDINAIPKNLFEPAKNYTTQAAQPVPACLPALPIPSLTPADTHPMAMPTQTLPLPMNQQPQHPTLPPSRASAATLSTEASPAGTDHSSDSGEGINIACITCSMFKIALPSPLRPTASRQALEEENWQLLMIARAAGIELEKNYAQMKLMDVENEHLQKKAFKKKVNKVYTSAEGRHLTDTENLEGLLRAEAKKKRAELHKDLAPTFKNIKKSLTVAEKERQKEEREKIYGPPSPPPSPPERGHGCGQGRAIDMTEQQGRGEGRGRGRGRGRVAPNSESDSEDFSELDNIPSKSDSDVDEPPFSLPPSPTPI